MNEVYFSPECVKTISVDRSLWSRLGNAAILMDRRYRAVSYANNPSLGLKFTQLTSNCNLCG